MGNEQENAITTKAELLAPTGQLQEDMERRLEELKEKMAIIKTVAEKSIKPPLRVVTAEEPTEARERQPVTPATVEVGMSEDDKNNLDRGLEHSTIGISLQKQAWEMRD